VWALKKKKIYCPSSQVCYYLLCLYVIKYISKLYVICAIYNITGIINIDIYQFLELNLFHSLNNNNNNNTNNVSRTYCTRLIRICVWGDTWTRTGYPAGRHESAVNLQNYPGQEILSFFPSCCGKVTKIVVSF